MHTRRFIAGPVLASVVDMLESRVRDGAWDLSRLIVVTPGSRAGRVLVSMLAERAATLRVPLGPPMTITPSELAGSILVMLEGAHGNIGGGWRERPPASTLIRRSMWIRALRSQPLETLRAITALDPAPDDARAWSALARVLERSADDLASAGFRLHDAAARAAELADFNGQQRLTAAAHVQDAYESLLAQHGMSDPAIEAIDAVAAWRARLDRANHADTSSPDVDVLLIGVVELGRITRDACRLPGVDTTAVVAGPEAWRDHFDDLGCLSMPPPDSVEARALSSAELADQARLPWPGADDIWIGDTPRAQALNALAAIALASQDAPLSPHGVLLGVPDASVAFHLEREARRVGARVRAGVLSQVSHTEAFRTCEALLAHARDRTLATLRSLLLRPRVEWWVSARVRTQINGLAPKGVRAAAARGLLSAIDTYAERAVHANLDIGFSAARDDTRWLLDATRDALDTLTGPISDAPTGSSAAMALLRALGAIHRDAALDTSASSGYRREAAAAQAVAQGLREASTELADPFRSGPSSGSTILGAPDAIASLSLALSTIGDAPLAEDSEPDAIEGLGWLEIVLDPAPLVVLTGMNAGIVPSRATPDPLVPEALRRHMAMEHAGTRAARDSALFAAMLACKARVVAVLGRHDDEGAAMLPSPVLLPRDTDALATLLERFTRDSSGDTPAQRVRTVRQRPVTGPVTRPTTRPDPATPAPSRGPWVDAPIPTHLSVTSLRDYLRSPYIFYLKHVLRAKDAEALATTLEPSTMGSLLHRTLEVLHHHASDLADPRAIESLLMDELSTQVARAVAISHETRGTARTLLRLQVESVRERLRAAAVIQAQLRQDGWRIVASEVSLPGGLVVPHETDLPPFPRLRGKIDRIDINDAGEICVIDYKTGDTPKSPRASHNRSGAWIDLQLPLYRHMARAAVAGDTSATLRDDTDEAQVQLAYFNLCADATHVGLDPAGWTPDDLVQADDVARSVLRGITLREFDHIGEGINEEGAIGALAARAAAAQTSRDTGGGR